jgi:hypothetical protein
MPLNVKGKDNTTKEILEAYTHFLNGNGNADASNKYSSELQSNTQEQNTHAQAQNGFFINNYTFNSNPEIDKKIKLLIRSILPQFQSAFDASLEKKFGSLKLLGTIGAQNKLCIIDKEKEIVAVVYLTTFQPQPSENLANIQY